MCLCDTFCFAAVHIDFGDVHIKAGELQGKQMARREVLILTNVLGRFFFPATGCKQWCPRASDQTEEKSSGSLCLSLFFKARFIFHRTVVLHVGNSRLTSSPYGGDVTSRDLVGRLSLLHGLVVRRTTKLGLTQRYLFHDLKKTIFYTLWFSGGYGFSLFFEKFIMKLLSEKRETQTNAHLAFSILF